MLTVRPGSEVEMASLIRPKPTSAAGREVADRGQRRALLSLALTPIARPDRGELAWT
jgi:hypothetical protein